ncbi:HD domain-containing protein [Goodfellowiella coeruleoviolacea]|uniref:HD domain-containing protein n=1 Tax=Goodfellowiella coeruleoviolacea TaxID=334858 RepID=A0AAE3KJB2_9PSEU|nr:HD domain-containing protein [Goodfellowiella coeruleoviolacea]MCP2169430.1 HD domain-containing protein [Goodfellowiella coeruleoviolacea]
MTDKHDEAKTVSRRTALHRTAGLAAAGAVSAAFAAVVSTPTAAADPTTSSESGDTTANPGAPALPSSVAGVRIPDSALARRTAAFARGVSSETLFNHLMRTYLFGSLVFDHQGVRYDREVVFVAALLHDLGLLDAFQTPTERFEVDGADAARRFLREQRVPADRVELIWDAIALHTSVGIATRKRPEIALISVGSGMDFTGNELKQLPADALDEVLTVFPRKGFKREAMDRMLALCRTKPMGELMHPFAEVGRRHIAGFPVPTVEDMLLAAPFDE